MNADLELQQAVLAELNWEPSVNPAHIGVSVKEDVVTLAGHVLSHAEKYAAEHAAKRVAGVRGVINEIEVKLPEGRWRSDEDIAAAVVDALRANTQIPVDRIKVSVSKGWVTLEGEVEWKYQKDTAEEAIRHLAGLKGVSNRIIIKPHLPPEDLRARIENALKRSAEWELRRVRAAVEGSKVILRGTVRSWAARKAAEEAAWSAPGVAEVENRIVVRRGKPAWVVATTILAAAAVLIMALAVPALLIHDWLSTPPSNPAPSRANDNADKEPAYPVLVPAPDSGRQRPDSQPGARQP